MVDESVRAALTARLEELERQNQLLTALVRKSDADTRMFKWLAMIALLAITALLAWPLLSGSNSSGSAFRATDKGMSSGEFSLRDRNNIQMSVLECDKFGAPNLVMMDLKKRYRIGLKVWDDDRADLNLYDTNGQLKGRFGVGKDGEVALVLTSEEGKEHVRLAVAADGKPTLRLTGADGQTVFQAP